MAESHCLSYSPIPHEARRSSKYPEREGTNVFKVVYRRHTNFAMESIENPFNGAPNFGKKVTCTIQRNGDLIHRMYLQATLPQVALQPSDGSGAQFRWLNWIGHNLIDYVEIEIGGQRINSVSAEKYHYPMACCAA